MRALPNFLFVVATAWIAGCGGISALPSDGGAPDGGTETSTLSGDGGCINPTQGASCTPNEVACQPPDICCAGYSWMCQNGAWAKAGVGCACYVGGPFPCGSTTCNSKSQYCLDQPPGMAFDGAVPPDYYSCGSLPADCTSYPTCACLTAHNPCLTSLVSCNESNGAVTVVCLGE